MLKVFNYQCLNQECNNFFEKYVNKYDEVVACPNCDGQTEKRLTMPAFTLKGVGVYNSGTFSKAHEGPKLDQDLLRLSDRDLNIACGLPPDCA